MKRREVLRLGGTLATGAMMGTALWRALIGGALRADAADCPPAVGGPGPYGPLLAPDANGIMLPARLPSRVVARAGQTGRGHRLRLAHLPRRRRRRSPRAGGWVYVSNSECAGPNGGVSALRFDRTGDDRRRLRHLHRHDRQLRRRRNAVGHLALLRGVATAARLGVRSERRRAGRACGRRSARSSTRRWPSIAGGAASTSPRTSADGRFYRFTPDALARARRGHARGRRRRRRTARRLAAGAGPEPD